MANDTTREAKQLQGIGGNFSGQLKGLRICKNGVIYFQATKKKTVK